MTVLEMINGNNINVCSNDLNVIDDLTKITKALGTSKRTVNKANSEVHILECGYNEIPKEGYVIAVMWCELNEGYMIEYILLDNEPVGFFDQNEEGVYVENDFLYEQQMSMFKIDEVDGSVYDHLNNVSVENGIFTTYS